MPLNKHILKRFLSPIFVETGTYQGTAIKSALAAGFRECYSVELSQHWYDYNKDQFREDTRVHLIHGDSAWFLWDAIKNIHERITFWLDAHQCSDLKVPGSICHLKTARGDVRTPILEELDLIGRHPRKDHIILIDDMRQFNGKDFEATKEEIEVAVKEINSSYKISYIDSYQHKTLNFEKDILAAHI